MTLNPKTDSFSHSFKRGATQGDVQALFCLSPIVPNVLTWPMCLLPHGHQVVFASPGITCNCKTERRDEELKAFVLEGFVVLGTTGSY